MQPIAGCASPRRTGKDSIRVALPALAAGSCIEAIPASSDISRFPTSGQKHSCKATDGGYGRNVPPRPSLLRTRERRTRIPARRNGGGGPAPFAGRRPVPGDRKEASARTTLRLGCFFCVQSVRLIRKPLPKYLYSLPKTVAFFSYRHSSAISNGLHNHRYIKDLYIKHKGILKISDLPFVSFRTMRFPSFASCDYGIRMRRRDDPVSHGLYARNHRCR